MKKDYVVIEPVFKGMEYKFIWMAGDKEVIITQGYDVDPEVPHVGAIVQDESTITFDVDYDAMDIADAKTARPKPNRLLLELPSFVKDKDIVKIILSYFTEDKNEIVLSGEYEINLCKPSIALIGIAGVSVPITKEEVVKAYDKLVKKNNFAELV